LASAVGTVARCTTEPFGHGARTPLAIGNVSPVLCGVGLVQVLGIVAAIASRLAEGTPREQLGHCLCVVALAAVGGLCGFCLQYGPDSGAMCAVTFTVMTMITIVDLRPSGDG
jgi:hypothetical protein